MLSYRGDQQDKHDPVSVRGEVKEIIEATARVRQKIRIRMRATFHRYSDNGRTEPGCHPPAQSLSTRIATKATVRQSIGDAEHTSLRHDQHEMVEANSNQTQVKAKLYQSQHSVERGRERLRLA
jgi:hypothetical protein